MAILLNEKTKVLIQGITGREGQLRTRLALDYGTKVVAGVTPGRGGTDVYGVPVYDTVAEAIEAQGPIDLAAAFVPAPFAKSAALEAIYAGVKTILILLIGFRIKMLWRSLHTRDVETLSLSVRILSVL